MNILILQYNSVSVMFFDDDDYIIVYTINEVANMNDL